MTMSTAGGLLDDLKTPSLVSADVTATIPGSFPALSGGPLYGSPFAPPARYEYMELILTNHNSLIARLNELGAEGWAVSFTFKDDLNKRRIVLMRLAGR